MPEIRIHIPFERSRCGILQVVDESNRAVLGPFPVGTLSCLSAAISNGNPSRSPLLRFGNSPTGTYRIVEIVPSGVGTQYDALDFGRYGIIVLEPVAGDAALADAAGRSRMCIHGGATGAEGRLRTTNGAFRISDRHQRALARYLNGRSNIMCQCTEGTSQLGAGKVIEDRLFNQGDPYFLLRRTIVPRHDQTGSGISRRRVLGGALAVMSAAFTLSGTYFVRVTPASAQGGTEYSSQQDRTEMLDQEMEAVAESGPDSLLTTRTLGERLTDIYEDAKKDIPDEAMGQALEDLEEATKATAEALRAKDLAGQPTFSAHIIGMVSDTDMTFRVTKSGVAAEVLDGLSEGMGKVSAALDLKDSFEKGTEVGQAVNDLMDGKISGTAFVEKVGPVPAKLLLGGKGLPFADQAVDATVAAGQAALNKFVGPMIDAYFDYRDAQNGITVQKPGKASGDNQ